MATDGYFKSPFERTFFSFSKLCTVDDKSHSTLSVKNWSTVYTVKGGRYRELAPLLSRAHTRIITAKICMKTRELPGVALGNISNG